MRIYRIAMPLPLDEIAMSNGGSKIEYELDEHIIRMLDEKYSFKSFLGSGDFGIAYSTFDDKVVKLTTDHQEFKLAKDLIGDNWQRHAPFARVYEAEKLSEDLYIIIKELLRPLDEEEQGLFMIFMDEFNGTVDDISGDYQQYMLLFEKFEEYYMDVMNYMFADCLNSGNIGWDHDNNLKAFDPRLSES